MSQMAATFKIVCCYLAAFQIMKMEEEKYISYYITILEKSKHFFKKFNNQNLERSDFVFFC